LSSPHRFALLPPQSTSVSDPSIFPLFSVFGVSPDEEPDDEPPLEAPPDDDPPDDTGVTPLQFDVQFGSVLPSSVLVLDVDVHAAASATANSERTRAATG
jgi:hypothetical protein